MKDTKDPPKTSPPSIHLNWEDWLPYLEDTDIPEADKRKTIEAVWDIAMAFVDFRWTLTDGEKPCGQSFDLTAALHAAVLDWEDQEHQEQEAV